MKLKIEFELMEDIEKQVRDWEPRPELITEFKNNKEKFYKKEINDVKEAITREFTFGEYEWVKNLKVELVEE
uniref:Uncharacterized protein n=1 Tax=Firmicutes phage HS17 TaxID=3056395 RepID=A0AA49X347_9VIRU|nr:MAG: hypothetical protein [Firmicutes phage HS17]WLJ26211.1 MAG: hypothetical protein [Firmicutes phage HS17]